MANPDLTERIPDLTERIPDPTERIPDPTERIPDLYPVSMPKRLLLPYARKESRISYVRKESRARNLSEEVFYHRQSTMEPILTEF